MEVKDKLKPYLGTKTILIIDNEEDWLQIYDKLRHKSSAKFDIVAFKGHGDDNLSINLTDIGYETQGNLSWFKEQREYKNYKYFHSKDLLNTTRKYNLWKLKLTTS